MEKEETPERSSSSSSPGEEKPAEPDATDSADANANAKADANADPKADANANVNVNADANASTDVNADATSNANADADANAESMDEKEEKEEKNDEGEKVEEERREEEEPDDADFGSNFHKFSEEIDRFISNAKKNEDPESNPPEIPKSVEKFTELVEGEISKFDSSKEHGKWSHEFNEDSVTLLQAIDKVAVLTDVLQRFASNPNYMLSINHTSSLLQQAMAFLEDEFQALLEDYTGVSVGSDSITPATRVQKTKQPSFELNSPHEADKNALPENDPGGAGGEDNNFPGYSPTTMSTLIVIAKAMISAGYESECLQIFTIVRLNLFEESLNKAGLERMSVEDVQKMNWEPLEGDIVAWTNLCRLCIRAYFSAEKQLCETIFGDHPSISNRLFNNLARAVIFQFLNFAEAVAMTKKSAERLFKFLDIYETLRDLMGSMDTLFQGESLVAELKSETSSARCHIGQASVCIFSDLENSIKADNGKIPVPGGAVHPLTRYVLNYLKYACEYKETLEEVFQEHQKPDNSDTIQESENEGEERYNGDEEEKPISPFAEQLMVVMDLLDSNLDVKSKLYKDLSLSYIFLMNNGQYIMQRIRGSPEIHDLLGDTWRRKRSTDLRQYHKNYQRETWSKVLGCLKDEGLLHGKGNIVKPALKERFKSFNAMMDEIHRTQSAWVISDEQLQSELRVSIGAVVIPAYRSFLGRFEQYLDPGRQTEKYIKYGPEEVEAAIDELFDGTPATMLKRR
ncbi:hypothetical protein AAC387_Pa02g3870 [Persea americana]